MSKESKRRYNCSPKGKAAQKRYWRSAKGIAAHRRADAKCYAERPEVKKAQSKRSREATRLQCLIAYGGDPPQCQCPCGCTERRIKILEIHHIHGDGGEHRKEIGGSASLTWWLKKHEFPDGYSVRCPSCHSAEHYYGKCEKLLDT